MCVCVCVCVGVCVCGEPISRLNIHIVLKVFYE